MIIHSFTILFKSNLLPIMFIDNRDYLFVIIKSIGLHDVLHTDAGLLAELLPGYDGQPGVS